MAISDTNTRVQHTHTQERTHDICLRLFLCVGIYLRLVWEWSMGGMGRRVWGVRSECVDFAC